MDTHWDGPSLKEAVEREVAASREASEPLDLEAEVPESAPRRAVVSGAVPKVDKDASERLREAWNALWR